jgi:ankyrin repeat protein
MRRLVCEVGIDVNSIERFGKTPLHTLSFMINGNDNAMRVLIELDADLDRRDQSGWMALHYASARACFPSRLPQLYIAAGADFLLVDKNGPISVL